jgi:hypothetical protein
MFLLGSLLILLGWLRAIQRPRTDKDAGARSRQPGARGELTPPQS